MQAFTGKVAIVFAASRGIGRAVAERLAHDGASVTVNFLANRDEADAVVGAIRAAGGDAIAVRGDASKSADVAGVFDATIERWGAVDIVVNAAGRSVFKPIVQITDEDFEQVLSVNARGALFVLREAALRIADGGRIVQFSTGGTKMTMAGSGAYSASKAAGETLALNLAKELGERRITVNVVSPGATDTDGLVMPKAQLDQIVAMTPLGRLGQPADVAAAVVFLVSDDAHWVTGQNLQVNGGIL